MFSVTSGHSLVGGGHKPLQSCSRWISESQPTGPSITGAFSLFCSCFSERTNVMQTKKKEKKRKKKRRFLQLTNEIFVYYHSHENWKISAWRYSARNAKRLVTSSGGSHVFLAIVKKSKQKKKKPFQIRTFVRQCSVYILLSITLYYSLFLTQLHTLTHTHINMHTQFCSICSI